MFGGSFLTSLAGAFVGSMIAQQFFDSFDTDPGYGEGGLEQEVGADEPIDDTGGDTGGDFGGDTGGDFGGDF
jgi:hypothetical protein